MPSAALPPELHQIARDAARNGAPPGAAAHRHDPRARPLPADGGRPERPTIAERIGVDDHWIVKRTGIHARRRAAANEGTSDLAVFAARRALQDAGVDARDLDFVIVATMSPTRSRPTARRWSPTRSAPSAPPRSTSAPPAPASSRGSLRPPR